MADAENALRQEIQKVYDRALERARAEGRSDAEAEAHADDQRKQFMEKWDIRPDMLGAPPPVIRHAGPARHASSSSAGFMGQGLAAGEGKAGGGAAARAAAEAAVRRQDAERAKVPVDLGSSAFRTSVPASSGKTKIGDLLNRARMVKAELEARGAASVPTPVPAPAPPRAAFTGGRPAVPPGTRLNDLVNRAKQQRAVADPRAVEEPPPVPPIRIGPVREHRRALDEPPPPDPYGRDRHESPEDEMDGDEQAPVETPVPPATEDREIRRRAVLEEFDRTYEKVLAHVESRIEMIDLAVGEENGAPLRGPTEAPAEMVTIAEDLDHLLGELHRMADVCERLASRLGVFLDTYPPGGAGGHSHASGAERGEYPEDGVDVPA